MTGGQEKNFSTLGPKLSGSKAQQYYGDKQRQIRIEMIVYPHLRKFFIRSFTREFSHIISHQYVSMLGRTGVQEMRTEEPNLVAACSPQEHLGKDKAYQISKLYKNCESL